MPLFKKGGNMFTMNLKNHMNLYKLCLFSLNENTLYTQNPYSHDAWLNK